MKKINLLFALFACIFLTINAHAQTKIDDVITFKNAQYQMGKITFGKPVTYSIDMTNISKDTITLLNARAACGCTTPNFKPNQKIGPGQNAQVQITFNGSVMGAFSRSTVLEFGGNLQKITSFSGEGVAIVESNSLPNTSSTQPNKQ